MHQLGPKTDCEGIYTNYQYQIALGAESVFV